MPDGRSLCDRRAKNRIRIDNLRDMSDDEFAMYVDEQTDSPACGSCILMAERIRVQAATLLRHSGRVHPPTLRDALLSLDGTRWADPLGLSNAKFPDAGDETETTDEFERIVDALPEMALNEAAEAFSESRARLRDRLEKLREPAGDE